LSAKYGLIPDNKVISPYNLTLTTMSKNERIAWSQAVSLELNNEIPDGSCILLLAGTKYLEFLDLDKFKIYNPLKGLGIGRRLQYLKIWTNRK
jgi:cytoplasmic iron level regulating protein YaaA (DUF328/UPF0246 family)